MAVMEPFRDPLSELLNLLLLFPLGLVVIESGENVLLV
jgi:hypothetical protein